MISNNAELWGSVKELSEKLLQAGEEQWSRALHDAMYISTVTGEVMGETRAQLQSLRRSPVPQRLQLEKQIGEAIAYIDKALRPW